MGKWSKFLNAFLCYGEKEMIGSKSYIRDPNLNTLELGLSRKQLVHKKVKKRVPGEVEERRFRKAYKATTTPYYLKNVTIDIVEVS
jgi:hypothetical protein